MLLYYDNGKTIKRNGQMYTFLLPHAINLTSEKVRLTSEKKKIVIFMIDIRQHSILK